jgi:hypothetical protein
MITKYLLLTALLFSQQSMTDDEYQEELVRAETIRRQLEQEYIRAQPGGPESMLITVFARFGDGAPARGYISCEGTWCKYDEQEYCATSLPFKTDSRGACAFNPGFEWLGDDGHSGYMTCHATSGPRSGKLTFRVEDGGRYVITIPGPRPTLSDSVQK